MAGSVNDSHCAVAVADFDRIRSSNIARFACGKIRSLPTKARPIISFEPVQTKNRIEIININESLA